MTASTIRLTALSLLLLGAASCSSSSAPDEVVRQQASRAYHRAQNLPSTGLALEGYCPVAYFAVNEPILGSAEYAVDHGGATYWFVSEDARQAFVQDPEKYLPAYGGWCAFGMAVQDKFPVDPTSFKIVDGRLMLFLRNPSVDALELWQAGEEAELTAKADAHWRQVQG